MSRLYPLSLDLRGKRVLIAGGGQLALQKLRSLEGTGAQVTVVAPELRGEWGALAHEVRIERRGFEAADLEGAALVFAATDDAALNHRIVGQARSAGVLANAVDDPGYCDFHTPAVLRRGAITLALSTDGAFPGLSRALREALEAWLPERDGAWVDALIRLRARIRESALPPAGRSAALRKLARQFQQDYLLAPLESGAPSGEPQDHRPTHQAPGAAPR